MWWEIDMTWYVLRGLAAVHVIRDVKLPPARLLTQSRLRDGAFDIGMFRSFGSEQPGWPGRPPTAWRHSGRPTRSRAPKGTGARTPQGGATSPADTESVAGPRQALSGLIHPPWNRPTNWPGPRRVTAAPS